MKNQFNKKSPRFYKILYFVKKNKENGKIKTFYLKKQKNKINNFSFSKMLDVSMFPAFS